MNKLTLTIALASLPLALAACGKKAEQPAAVATQAMDKMGSASAATPAKPMTGTGEGKVISLNAATGAITIEHGPIKEINWPAMTMGFSAKPDLLKGIAVGDRVAFTILGSGENYAVTAIHKE